jgi:hypothetical protein
LWCVKRKSGSRHLIVAIHNAYQNIAATKAGGE